MSYPEYKENFALSASLNTISNKWDLETRIPDLTGKVALVTGANSPNGIGFHTAHQLLRKGAKVYVSARNLDKAQEAIAELKKRTPDLKDDSLLQPIAMDLGDFKEVKNAAELLSQKESRLDILINNAGLLARPLDKYPNGISVSMAVNHLAPFLFTTELLPLLKRTAAAHPGVRVINVASTTHLVPPSGVKLGSLEDFNQDFGSADDFGSNYARYGLSKLANILFTKELQKRFDAENVAAIAIALHPGNIKTDGAIAFAGDTIDQYPGLLSPLEGAMTSLFAAANPVVWEEKEKYAGGYLMPYGVLYETSENAKNPELARTLWETSEKVLRSLLE